MDLKDRELILTQSIISIIGYVHCTRENGQPEKTKTCTIYTSLRSENYDILNRSILDEIFFFCENSLYLYSVNHWIRYHPQKMYHS